MSVWSVFLDKSRTFFALLNCFCGLCFKSGQRVFFFSYSYSFHSWTANVENNVKRLGNWEDGGLVPC